MTDVLEAIGHKQICHELKVFYAREEIREAKQLKADELRDLKEEAGQEYAHQWVNISHPCGYFNSYRVLCSNPLCIPCQKQKAYEARSRWLPVLQRMKSPRMITLTIPDGPILEARLIVLSRSFRKFMNMRLGKENLKDLQSKALVFLLDHLNLQLDRGELTQSEYNQKWIAQARSIDIFIKSIRRRKNKRGDWPEIRHVIGDGFRALEALWGDELRTGVEDWHCHYHLCVDGQFIPWALLCAAWLKATNNTAFITHIEQVEKSPDGIAEVLKYLTKPWEIPVNKQVEFSMAVRGLKRIWPLGHAKPDRIDNICPGCGDPTCKGTIAGHTTLIEIGSYGHRPARLFRDGDPDGLFRLMVRMDQTWYIEYTGAERPLLDANSNSAAVLIRINSPNGP